MWYTTGFMFFCCHKCHNPIFRCPKNGAKNSLQTTHSRNKYLSQCKKCSLQPNKALIRNTLSIIVWHLWQQKVKTSCNARMRARVRVRFLLIHCFFAETTLRFTQHRSTNTDWLLYVYTETHNNIISCKQAVVLVKTTRRFNENKPSF